MGKDDDDSDFYYVRQRKSDDRIRAYVFGFVFIVGFGAMFIGVILKALGVFN